MKQVTGNKSSFGVKKVSIQLALDGHSFSTEQLTENVFPGEDAVEVELLTPHTMLVPAELFDMERAADLFAANGMPVHPENCIINSDPQAEIIALMEINKEQLDLIEGKLGERARYTSPLLYVPLTTDRDIWLCRRGWLLYIKVYAETLRMAEVIEAPSDADIRYMIERLGSELALSDFRLRAAGDNPLKLVKLIGEKFREIVCE